jgi:hypothetical protein
VTLMAMSVVPGHGRHSRCGHKDDQADAAQCVAHEKLLCLNVPAVSAQAVALTSKQAPKY